MKLDFPYYVAHRLCCIQTMLHIVSSWVFVLLHVIIPPPCIHRNGSWENNLSQNRWCTEGKLFVVKTILLSFTEHTRSTFFFLEVNAFSSYVYDPELNRYVDVWNHNAWKVYSSVIFLCSRMLFQYIFVMTLKRGNACLGENIFLLEGAKLKRWCQHLRTSGQNSSIWAPDITVKSLSDAYQT